MAGENENGTRVLAEAVRDVRIVGDKYRAVLNEESRNTVWRHGGPPIFDAVNQLFVQGRTKEWPEGSLEEAVQNAVKSWETELSHKTRLQDFKTINPEKFRLFVSGREGISGEETLCLGSYNTLLKSPLPDEFRHWGHFEGDFKGHAPTGEMVEFYGVGIMKVDDDMRAEDVEVYYDPGELFAGLLKGRKSLSDEEEVPVPVPGGAVGRCPFSGDLRLFCWEKNSVKREAL
ncbi:hypothetical protein MLD38_002288 [Melastoma candidum]|uniref:Uncharacterized protein n=1 Tax=Melastoma candidum TaxID=119954 RepID=A0ACB9SHZ5_9MYRT|nr:hypothetical protein MLD38_002288 [Melastoma candidum]